MNLTLLAVLDWSSSLAFAPTRRPQPAKSKARPPPAFSFNSQPNTTPSTDVVRSAQPVINLPAPSLDSTSTIGQAASTNPSSTTSSADTRALPLLTLDDDVNGFKKRRANESNSQPSESHKRSKRRKKQAQQQPGHLTFNPHETYDPSKPNDLSEYKRWREEERKRKERERREKRERERQQQARGAYGSGSDSGSYYSEDESEDERVGGGGGLGAQNKGRLNHQIVYRLLISP